MQLHSSLNHINRYSTVFAYGQTGSGKTYTMMGVGASSQRRAGAGGPDLRGLVPRCLDYIFSHFQRKADKLKRATRRAEKAAARAAEKEKAAAEEERAALTSNGHEKPPAESATKPPVKPHSSPGEFSFLATAHFLEVKF